MFAPEINPWFAIRVRSRSEKLAAADLAARQFPVCAATAPQRRVWSDRVRLVEMPLFPGYVFARFAPEQRASVLRAAGVVGIVGCGGIDCPVSEAEMDSVRTLIASGVPWLHNPFLRAGAWVRIRGGSLDGLTGRLLQVKNELRVVVTLELLHRAVAVEVNASQVEVIQETLRVRTARVA